MLESPKEFVADLPKRRRIAQVLALCTAFSSSCAQTNTNSSPEAPQTPQVASVPQVSPQPEEFPYSDDYLRIYREKGHPFEITDEIEEKAKELTLNDATETDKAKAIFDWMVAEFSYGQTKIRERRGFDKVKEGRRMYCWKGIRHAPEIFSDREGVCDERSELYITMLRSIGLKAAYVHVSVDVSGKDKMRNNLTNSHVDFSHGCAAVYADKEVIIVDPTYEIFDVKHREFTIIPSERTLELFKGYDRTTTCGYY